MQQEDLSVPVFLATRCCRIPLWRNVHVDSLLGRRCGAVPEQSGIRRTLRSSVGPSLDLCPGEHLHLRFGAGQLMSVRQYVWPSQAARPLLPRTSQALLVSDLQRAAALHSAVVHLPGECGGCTLVYETRSYVGSIPTPGTVFEVTDGRLSEYVTG